MTRARLTTPVFFASLVASLLLATTSQAAIVTNLRAEFRDGQTFLTWDNLPGTGWIYHIFRSSSDFRDPTTIEEASEVAQVGDLSSVDQRISSLLGSTLTFRVSPSEPPLPVSRGLFVATATVPLFANYAIVAERAGTAIDHSMVPGGNTTVQPVFEFPQTPHPVWQRTLSSPRGEDYVLWTTNEGTSSFPAMCNLPGRAFHFGVIPGARGGALMLHGHGRGGNFFNSFIGSGTPGEWVISVDDYLPTGDFASFYFGYEETYDLDTPYNYPRADGGKVVDYTEQRVMFLLGWAERELPHDPTRVYAMGTSMGGSFAFFLAWHHPEKIAAALAVVPKLCLGYREDMFEALAESIDRIWGSQALNLPTTTGERVFNWMDGRQQARLERHRGSAPIVGFCGLNDNSVGWAEKVAYFRSMEALDAGGTWFWDERDHTMAPSQTAWYPMMAASQLYKYRSDRSYPGFSNCSVDGNFGTGDPATADPIGSLNGAVDFDENTISDGMLRWDVTVRTRALVTQDGFLAAPESLLVDVTPRRVQQFILAQRVNYRYEVRRLNDNVLLQSGTATPDDDAVLTVRGVKVFASGVRVSMFPTSTTGVTPELSARFQPHVSLSRNPVPDRASLRVEWPTEGEATIELMDMTGRRVRTEFHGIAKGVTERLFRTDGLAPGLYLVSARQGAARSSRRVTVLH